MANSQGIPDTRLGARFFWAKVHKSDGCWEWTVFNALPKHLYVRGERQGHSKLTTLQVLEMRSLAADGVPTRAIAAKMNVTAAHVRKIVIRKLWAHV